MDDRMPDYKPHLPDTFRPGIGIVGCGTIVERAHLPAYRKYGLGVTGLYDISKDTAMRVKEQFGVARVFASLEEMLAHPQVQIVDVAVHPQDRLPIVSAACAAGKHILCQKPLAIDVLAARAMIKMAKDSGVILAVNLNARWAPALRVTTKLIQDGQLGDILAITHIYDRKFDWIPGTVYDKLKHFALYDYSTHWVDITRCWAEGLNVKTVRARDYRTPNQPPSSRTPWGMWMEFEYEGGANALIRGIGCSETGRKGHPFYVHGTKGTIRGSVLGGDHIELERGGRFTSYQLEGEWFPDGFAGSMGELLCSLEQGREPYNSAEHNLLSLQMTLAACRSADLDGQAVTLE